MVKRSVSFDSDVWSELSASVAGAAVSPLVNDAVAFYLRRERGLAAVGAYEEEHGAFTAAELAAADRALERAGVADLMKRSGKTARKPRR